MVLCLVAAISAATARGQGRILRIDLLGKKYDVYATRDSARITALNNRQNFDIGGTTYSVATAAGIFQGGNPLGFAGIFSPTAGRSFVTTNFAVNSVAEDISDSGVVIGWQRHSNTVADRTHPERAFIWDSTNGMRYLDDLFPEVRALGARLLGPNQPVGVQGMRINSAGEMIVYSPLSFDNIHPPLFKVSPFGAVSPLIVETNQSYDLNNLGAIPPPQPGGQSLVLNDNGQFAGRVFDSYPPTIGGWSATLNGQLLSDSHGATPTSINNLGYVGANPGFIWTPDGTRVDVRQAIAIANTNNVLPGFNNAYYAASIGDVFINDAGDIVWAGYMMIPVCPEISLGVGPATGIELFNGSYAVRVGARFSATAIIQNIGAVPLIFPTVELAPPSRVFRQVAGPTPALPAVLNPGQQVSVVLEWEALAPGNYIGSFSVRGDADCGPFETHINRGLIQFIDPPLGIRFDTDPVTDPTNTVHLCNDFNVVATVTNLTSVTLTNVAPLSPPTNGVNGVLVALGDAAPASVPTIAPGGIATFKWPMRGGKVGDATPYADFTGRRNDALFKVGPTVTSVLHVLPPELIVNTTGDEPDADLTDQCPDVDLVKPGLQTTLRAAIQNANAYGGTNVIRFDLPADSNRTIGLLSPLPPITGVCEIVGTNKSGGLVAINAYSIPANSAALELKGQVKVSGLAFSTSGFSDGVAIRISEGQSTVTGCRFGQDANGASAPLGFGILCTIGGQQIGGTGAGDGNYFERGKVGVLVQKPTGGTVPTGVIIEGNRFGRLGADSKHGPDNAIAFINVAGSRIGGTSVAARNIFVGTKSAAVGLLGPETAGNDIQGNWFGLSEAGDFAAVEFLNGYGIALAVGAHHNRIGGPTAGAGNIVSGCDDGGIALSNGAHDNTMEGNWIGPDASGAGTGNANSAAGVWIISGYSNRIGGASIAQRNIISGNRNAGIRLGRAKEQVFKDKLQDPGTELCAATRIEGNWIGLDASGTHAAPNGRDWSRGSGVEILPFATATLLGGESPGRRNVISGNFGPGIFAEADAGTSTLILGNRIGTSVDGLGALPNMGSGIEVKGEPVVVIGGVAAGQGNQIAFNQGPGVNLTKLKAVVPGISLAGNLIHDNAPAGSIALAARRLANDPGDGDTGPNGLQNWPMPVAAANLAGATLVAADLSGFARGVLARIDVFSASGGGGKTLIGTSTVTTGSDPKDRYVVSCALQFAGAPITLLATTTDGTSEFSPPIKVVSGLDSDGDGIPDALERAVPVTSGSPIAPRSPVRPTDLGNPTLGDRNADGIPDETQANVASAQIPDTGPWITLSAAPGRALTDLVGLRAVDVAALPSGYVVKPGAVRFTLGGGSGTAEPLSLWLEPLPAPPTVWLSSGPGWIQTADVTVQTFGPLWKVAFTLPPAPAGSAWILALGQPAPVLPAPVLALLPLDLRPLARAAAESPVGLTYDAATVPAPGFGWVQPLTIDVPAAAADWTLQTSADLVLWDNVPRPLALGATNVFLSYPPDDPARFFRWCLP